MSSKGQLAMVCFRNAIETRGESQPLQGDSAYSSLPSFQGKDNRLAISRTLGDLLVLSSNTAARDRDKFNNAIKDHYSTEGFEKDLQVADEGKGNANVLLKKKKRQSTLKDLFERASQQEEGRVNGDQLAEQQGGKRGHSELKKPKEADVTKWDCSRVGVGLQDVVVAVNNDQRSKDALMWTLSHLVPPAAAVTLLHVRPLTKNIAAQRQWSRKSVIAHQKAKEILREHQGICNKDKVDSKIVTVEGDSVAKTLVEQISRLRITKLVLGMSPRNLITRNFRRPQIPAYVAKNAPPFCTVMVVSKTRLVSMKKAECLPAEVPPYYMEPKKSNINKSIQQRSGMLADEFSVTDVIESQAQNFAVCSSEVLYAPGQGFSSTPLARTMSIKRRHWRSSLVPARNPISFAISRGQIGEVDTEDFFSSFDSVSGQTHEKFKAQASNELSWDLFKHMPSTSGHSMSLPSSPSYSMRKPVSNTWWNVRVPRNARAHGRATFGMEGPIAAASAPCVLAGYSSTPTSPRGESVCSDCMTVVEVEKQDSFGSKDRGEETASFMGFKFEEDPSSVEPIPSFALLESPILLDEVKILRDQLKHAQLAVQIASKDARDNAQRCKEAEEAAAKALSKAELSSAKQEEEAKMKEEALGIAEAAKLHATEEARKCSKALELAKAAQEALEEETHLRMKAEEKAKQEWDARQAVLAVLQKAHFLYREFGYEELRSASDNFSEDHKLGEGGYGTVYQGTLHHTTVAIKVLNPDGVQGPKEFQREVELLGRIHHPHMVMLLGCCPEKGCLVYEYMANGSLEDRLLCKGNTPPLQWNTRLRVAAEIATALLFLHSSRPEPIVHCDLKPANVLLDKNFVSKLGDVGLARLVPERYSGNATLRDTVPVGTFAYIDPEYQRTGWFGPKSDVYALGILILQLLVSGPPVGVYETVEVALENGALEEVLDYSAGEWPIEETREVATLALECAEMRRRNRPDLETRVLPVLEKMRTFAEVYASKDLCNGRNLLSEGEGLVPAMFMCPLYQELMEDPVIAADGHTYEYEAIQQWLEQHETSPMTNLWLAHREVTPNHALRSAICKWEVKFREKFTSSASKSPNC